MKNVILMNNLGENAMGRIVRDYKCEQHGYFEAYAPICPEGCEKGVMVVFLQAPGVVSAKTRKNDKTVRKLADDFKMTDVKSTREGENQAGYYTRNNDPAPKEIVEAQQVREARPGDAAIWGGGINNLTMPSLLKGNAIRPVRDEQVGFNPKQNSNLTGPRAASYVADHENLSIKG
jgi:hypothetical protein